MQNFANAGSLFHNYKNTFSLVLFGICDAKYRFIYCNIGSAGSANDAAIWTQCNFKKSLDQGQLQLPVSEGRVKYHLVGDDIFGLEETMMKPYPRSNLQPKELVFNYRLSRARRTIENAFGIVSSRFRILRTPLLVRADNAQKIIQACVVLHNFLIDECRPSYLAPTDFSQDKEGLPKFADDEDYVLPSVNHLVGNRSGRKRAREQRDFLADFFMNEGAVPFQWKMVFGK